MNNYKIAEICTITMGQSPESKFYNATGEGFPFLQGCATFGVMYPSFSTWTTHYSRYCESGEVLMSVRAPVGDLNISQDKIALGRGVCSLSMNNGNNRYLYYLLLSSLPKLKASSTGTIYESISKKDLERIELPVHSENNQQHIVNLLGSLDEKVGNNENIIKKTHEFALALFKQIFDGQAKEIVLSDIAEITMGQSPDGSSLNNENEGLFFFQGRTDFGMLSPQERIYTTAPTRYAKQGDILFSVRAPVGDVNIANTDCCIGRGLAAVRNTLGFENNAILFYILTASKIDFEVFNGSGTVFGSINKNELNNHKLKLGDAELIKRFDTKISMLFKKCLELNEENKKLKELKKLYLKKYFG